MRLLVSAVLLTVLLGPRAASAQGDPLGPEFRVNTYTTGFQAGPSIAVDSSGAFVVIWGGSDGGDPTGGIFGQRYDGSGSPLGSEFRANTYTSNAQYVAAVASDPSGDFVVAWASAGQDGSYAGVFAQRFDSSGAPLGPEFRVNSYTTNRQRFPSVAVAGSGDFVVAWTSTDQGGTGYDVFAQRFASSGAPSGPEFRVNTTVAFGQSQPDVAADSAGNFVVAWSSEYQGSPAGPVIWAQRYASSGAPLGVEFQVSEGRFNAIDVGPSLHRTSGGDFVAVWNTCCGTGLAEVFGRRFAASGAPLGTTFQVNTFTIGSQFGAGVAADASGNFVVTWSSAAQDGSGDGVFGQRFDSSGLPLGPEFRVNSYTTNDQSPATVAADPLGRFVVVWNSDLQDGSNTGIYGQRYTPMFPVDLMSLGVQ